MKMEKTKIGSRDIWEYLSIRTQTQQNIGHKHT